MCLRGTFCLRAMIKTNGNNHFLGYLEVCTIAPHSGDVEFGSRLLLRVVWLRCDISWCTVFISSFYSIIFQKNCKHIGIYLVNSPFFPSLFIDKCTASQERLICFMCADYSVLFFCECL